MKFAKLNLLFTLFGLLAFASNAQAQEPNITSATSDNAEVGVAYNYVITTDIPAIGYSATNLPAGLSRVGDTISGVPTAPSVSVVTLQAFNANGSGPSKDLTITVTDPVPVITSAATVNSLVNQSFNYQITATNSPTTYSQIGLGAVAGLSLDANTGLISGTPTVVGSYDVQLTATNGAGDSAGFALVININATGAPVITSASTTTGQVADAGFSYQIAATNSPTSFGVSSLSGIGGLSFNTATGLITGTPQQSGVFNVTVYASNATGTGSQVVAITINESNGDAPIPEIVSSLTANGTVGSAFSYQVSATNNPTSFNASGIGAISGLAFDSVTGIISGTPTATGDFLVILTASNTAGTSAEVSLMITINSDAPEITSNLTASGEAGVAFNYQIVASNSPTSYDAVGIAAIGGLTIDTTTGAISGSPLSTGSFNVVISATNAIGTDSKTLVLDITGDVPVITSSNTASGVENSFFFYQITADNDPTSFDATDLATIPGLSVNTSTGVISGAPTVNGVFIIDISATNVLGTATIPLTITIDEPLPTITSALSATAVVGEDFSYQITADNNPTSFDAANLAAIGGLVIDNGTGLITGQPVNSGVFTVSISATNATGTESEDLEITVYDSAPTIVVELIDNQPTPIVDPIEAILQPNGTFNSFNVVATVSPGAGSTIDLVTLSVDGSVFAQMTTEDGLTYSADLKIGFSPEDLEVTGGDHVITIRAFQTNGADIVSDPEAITVTPLAQLILPAVGMVVNGITAGDDFMVAKVQSNAVSTVVGSLIGAGNKETVNGVIQGNNLYSFPSTLAISIAGTYTATLEVTDIYGNVTTLSRTFLIEPTTGAPSVTITSPVNGFTSVPFSTAIISISSGTGTKTVNQVTLTGVLQDQDINILVPGSGYFPLGTATFSVNVESEYEDPNTGTKATALIQFTSTDGVITGATVLNSQPNNIGDPGFRQPFNYVLDTSPNSGGYAQVTLSADANPRTSPLSTVEFFVNGRSVETITYPDPFVTAYPNIPVFGSVAPVVGDYVAQAVVTDVQGKTGFSNPVQFTIRPKTTPRVTYLNAQDEITVNQGSQFSFLVNVESEESIQMVELLRGDTGEVLAVMQRVSGTETEYRRTLVFDTLGQIPLVARATTVQGDIGESLPVFVTTIQFNDIQANFSNPTSDQTIYSGNAVDFSVNATSTNAIASVALYVNGILDSQLTASPFAFNRVFPTPGTFLVNAEATDIYGNVAETETITVLVQTPPPPSVSLVSPITAQQITTGTVLDIEASADSVVGSIAQLDILLNGTSIASFTSEPYTISYTFSSPGLFNLTASAVDSFGATSTSNSVPINVYVTNPILRNADFVSQTYVDLFYRQPTTDELNEGIAYLVDNTRGEYIANLLNTVTDEASVLEMLEIYRTVVPEWLDYDDAVIEYASYQSTGPSGFVGTLTPQFFANNPTITLPLVVQDPRLAPLSSTPDGINEAKLFNALFLNKFGKLPEPALTYNQNVLAIVALDDTSGGLDLISQFAITNTPTGEIGPSGLFLTETLLLPSITNSNTFGYELPIATFVRRVKISQLIAGLLRRQPTDQEVAAAATSQGFTYAKYAQSLLDSPAYNARFASVYTLDLSVGANGSAVVLPAQPDLNDPSLFAFVSGTVAQLTATPDAGFDFLGWTGDVSSTTNPLSVTITSDLVINAVFAAQNSSKIVAKIMEDQGIEDAEDTDLWVDFDRDGFTNVEEFAFGTNPVLKSSVPVFETTLVDGIFTVDIVVMTQEELPGDLEIVLECNESLNLANWDAIDSSKITTNGVSQVGIPEGYEKVRVSLDVNSDCLFVRGRVVVSE